MILWKECLNGDGQQLHQYKQNYQNISSQTFEHKETTTYGFGNSGPYIGQAQ